MTTVPGRRERKKAATRQSIADAALRLFLERGYDQVGIRDIAEAADVSTTTLFKHFPGKEALVFDQADEREAYLVSAVRERPEGQGILDALREHVLASKLVREQEEFAEFTALIAATPALRDYSERMWARHADALTAAIADELGVEPDDLACATLARFVLQIPTIVRGRPDLPAAVEQVFALIEHGWHPPTRRNV